VKHLENKGTALVDSRTNSCDFTFWGRPTHV